MEVGGWVQDSLRKNNNWKIAQNYHILVLIIWGSVPCAFFVSTLLKVVSHYDLSVLSTSVMRFQKRLDGGGWVRRALSSFFGGFLELCKAPNSTSISVNELDK